ncbi:PleD family two-component system response regulator [Kaistia algarum]|uniref:PleD family two-component system response regulator n=1 Tax=Kaistia algarum TaxID=2083279 RepID=UPI000CE8B80A|nr:PleD family two-component system response regulator [Kaistia algarum]MCX5516263.1 PleD family two-component system response regulator [Kaistia algarum]PPE78813.1 PleD family two-component system response regulator [Kaistia algarum]
MTARVLVVDDIVANVKLLEARLSAEYFDVVTASNGIDALEICAGGQCDIVLLDVMMPGLDGFEVCRRIKHNPLTAHLPVIIITALDQPSDRIKGLDAGADDFLTKPINELALITRVKSLVRLKALTDQLILRASAAADLGIDEPLDGAIVSGEGGRILLVDDSASTRSRLVEALESRHQVDVEPDPQEAHFRLADVSYDLVVVSLDLVGFDGLRLCSQIRSIERTRMLPVLAIVHPDDTRRLERGLELGINDYLVHPIDRDELQARVRTQIRRHRFTERLRETLHATMEMAITDGLTGLHNRRYLERHLAGMFDQSVARRKPLSVLMLDVDFFKAVNDTYGHDAGDDVLREFARRVRRTVRNVDLVCRLGGEEFVVAMPDTDSPIASIIGERVRQRISGQSFLIEGGEQSISVTVSIGLASRRDDGTDSPEAMLRRADEALYRSKREGRNRVSSAVA